jgi:hypothetical protein
VRLEFGRGGVVEGEFRRRSAAAARCREEEEEGTYEGMGLGLIFIGGHGAVEEREREGQSRAEPRMAGGTGVLDGVAWQPLGIDCPTWPGEGRTAEAAWRWEEGWGNAWRW